MATVVENLRDDSKELLLTSKKYIDDVISLELTVPNSVFSELELATKLINDDIKKSNSESSVSNDDDSFRIANKHIERSINDVEEATIAHIQNEMPDLISFADNNLDNALDVKELLLQLSDIRELQELSKNGGDNSKSQLSLKFNKLIALYKPIKYEIIKRERRKSLIANSSLIASFLGIAISMVTIIMEVFW